MTTESAVTSLDRLEPVDFDEFGLSAFTFHEAELPQCVRGGRRPVMATHNHLEVELTVVEAGLVVLEFSGVVEHVCPGELVLYWGGVPHRVLYMAPGTRSHVAQVPLVDVLSWTNAERIVGLLLDGRFLREVLEPGDATTDPTAFARWRDYLRSDDGELRRAAALVIEARVRRFVARAVAPARPSVRRAESVTATRLVAATRFVMSHFTEPVTVDDVAASVGWHRDHLMASFRRFCGITLWDYVTRVRLAEAQRLLTTTDLPIMQICHGAGFGSTSQMYDVFKRHRGTTPARYRRAATASVAPS